MTFSLFRRQNFYAPRNYYNNQRSYYVPQYYSTPPSVPHHSMMGGRRSFGPRYGYAAPAPCSMSFRSSGIKRSGGGG